MKVPYVQILALTFFRFFITTRAMPHASNTSLQARAGDRDAQHGVGLNAPSLRRGLPINFMQNTDQSRPLVPIDNYKADVGRLAGNGQQ
ncbi:hypothetical protein BD414DRAFT_225939 [Trametes punicea]|nr:hypothetical protein BD414DRAFT_225939 [Trametes punicea]